MPIEIFSALISSTLYSSVYTTDNTVNLQITKSTGLIPFSLPIVDNTQETANRGITEQTELIHIGGVESTLNIDFEVGMGNVGTMLSLVTNKISNKHKIEIGDWSGLNSSFIYIGIIDSVKIKQDGGDPRINCSLSFMEGANTLAGLGY